MIDLSEVGASVTKDGTGNYSLRFGIYLPGVRSSDGFKLLVRIIHEADRFNPLVNTVNVELTWQPGKQLDLWTATTGLQKDPDSHYGRDGIYLYRFQLWHKSSSDVPVTVWATDPFSHRTDVGLLAGVEFNRTPATPFKWSDDSWKTPELDDLIVYELHIGQFNNTFDGIIDRIEYLKSLGVNCLELMPLTTTKLDYDWGYGPIQYFAPNPEYGGPEGLKRLVEACHQNGVAVILDLVYQHVDPSFPYNQIYGDIAARGITGIKSPMIGSSGEFGPQVDFSQQFAQEFFKLANQRWLDEYHVDGFRYDEVTDLYQGPTDTAYALLSYETYLYSRTIKRFGCGPGTYSRIIQTAEALGKAPIVLRMTYTSAAWQDELLNTAKNAIGKSVDFNLLTSFAHTLDPYFAGKYPATKTVVDSAGKPTEMPVAPFQYLNTHDHSHLICSAGLSGSGPLPSGDRTNFFKLQPFAIGLYTSQGVPMLWEGEEFADNYNVADDGAARVNLRRDVNWSYFYDAPGHPIVRLYRILGNLRRECPSLRSRESFFYYQQSLQGNSVLAYHRHAPGGGGGDGEQYAMVLLNFGSGESLISLPFPKAGKWVERIDGTKTVNVDTAGSVQTVSVPSWYGCVFIL
jgi:maltooligosyltrehalose trehalohydrolase